MNLVRELQQRTKGNKRIAVIGDSLVDIYVDGLLDDCQDNCKKFIEQSREQVPGGAANAARSLENWDVTCECFGNTLENSPIKTRFMVGDIIIMRHDVDAMDMDNRRRGIEIARLLDWKPDAVLISDYDKGFLTQESVSEIIEVCKNRGIPCIADAKRDPLLYRGTLVKCNLPYYTRWNMRFLEEELVVVTRGGTSAVITPILQETPKLLPIQCINHVGAGDCFAAHLMMALACGFSIQEAATIAHSAGRVYVQYPHNRPPHPEEIEKDLDSVSV